MSDRLSVQLEKVHARLDPIVAAQVDAAYPGFAAKIREVTAVFHDQPRGSQKVRAFSELYMDEYRARAKLVFDIANSNIDSFRPFDPIKLADDLKHFLNSHLRRYRVEFEREIVNHAGQAAQSRQLKPLVDFQQLYEEQLRQYSAKFDSWAATDSHRAKQDADNRSRESRGRWANWIVAVVAAIVGGVVGAFVGYMLSASTACL